VTEVDLVRKVVLAFESVAAPYFITGGMAAIAYGEPRFTNDLDVVADLNQSMIAPFAAQFPDSEYYLSSAAIQEAVRRRSQFNILHSTSGLKVDVMVAPDNEYNRQRFARRRPIDLGETTANFAAPEDVILKKLEYFQIGGSEKHLRDIASMLAISGDLIDRADISAWAERLGLTAQWQLILARMASSSPPAPE
jgi:hypothetical protein